MPADSPSASSVFLPLGKKTRRDSRSSLSKDLDQQAINEALKNIHHAASQSQNLTVFNEYTEPPSIPSESENRGFASEIQGSLTGLYNKFRASVGGAREPSSPLDTSSTDIPSWDKISSHPPSGKVSRINSPRMSAFEPSPLPDNPSQSSKFSSKAPSTTKLPLSSPGLRSPTATPLPAFLADPAVTEVNIHATSNARNHSRTGSAYSGDDVNRTDRNHVPSAEENTLRKVLSKGDSEIKPIRPERLLTSPRLSPLTKIDSQATSNGHERGPSDLSLGSASSRSANRALPNNSNLLTDEKHSGKASSSHRDSPVEVKSPTSPLSLLPEHDARGRPTSPKSDHRGLAKNKSPSADSRKPPDRLLPRVSQSRLPGFAVSRASSTDSGITAAATTIKQSDAYATMDGSHADANNYTYMRPVSKSRNRLLGKEFWMRDENARDCFRCGEPFSTFRRKHHCRTCGQIFDNKCTTLVPGTFFNTSSAVRVCRPCEAIILSHDDDSSDYSIDDGTISETATRPRTPEPMSARYDDDNISIMSQSLEQVAKTPTMSLPVRRAYDRSNGSSAILELDTSDRGLPRPSSSRSLKSSHLLGHGHKRHHSRHGHIRSFKAYHDDRAPFQRKTLEDLRDKKASAFHRDSIIDPELAQYLSDDASSGEEESVHEQAPVEKLSRSGAENDRTTIGGLLAAVRKGRSRVGDRSIAGYLNIGRDADDAASIISSRAVDVARGSRKRNLSVASSVHQRLTPKSTKERLQIIVPGDTTTDFAPSPAFPPLKASRMIRSASMRGMSAPALELNRASIQHVHKLLKQLLRDADIPKVSNWEEALMPILLRATDDVDPDVHSGDDIDIRNYVKLKKIPGGKPADTAYISGLVFTKNVALKSMSRCISNPRILIITFPLEYARQEQHFMSLDPVIRQEKEYLANIVGRIVALRPDVLLAQRNIAGLALELLDRANIATVFNVKPSILEAVSRCTQTRVNQSMDKLTSPSDHLGTCDTFEVKTFVAENRRKTYIYLSGCPPQLGCTIALRGSDRKTLSKIKRITDFMIYVVYNLKLETCLMRDEWALIPLNDDPQRNSNTSQNRKSIEHATKADEVQDDKDQSQVDEDKGENKSEPNSMTASQETRLCVPARIPSADSADIPDDIPVPTFYEDLADKHQTKILSASPFVKFAQPYLLMRARELERRVAYLKRLRDQDITYENATDEKARAQKFILIQPEMVHSSLQGASKKVREIIHAVHDAEYDKALYNYETQKRQWETYLSGNRNLFDPYAHQNIVVLFSQVSTATNVPCSGPDLLAFSFYNEHENEEEFEADCTLGQYVEDLIYRANDMCASDACERRMFEHHRQYVHGEAQISVFVQPHPPKMRGLQDVILMWSQCKICGTETTVTPMSVSTWKYSFGKYLELSFWSADLHARAGVCPHDLHRDHLRFFGYKDFALRVHYDPIDLLEIVVPRMRITWKVDNDLRFRNDVFTRTENRITRFMVSVKLRLKSINVDALLPESADECRLEVENLTKKANEDHALLIKQLQDGYSNSRHWETIPLNRSLRALQEKVADWDAAFADFEKNFFPSEKDIRRLATLQLKKIFLDRDVSVTSLTSGDDSSSISPGDETINEKSDSPDSAELKRKLSPEKTQNVLQSVLEEHSSNENGQNEIPHIKIEHQEGEAKTQEEAEIGRSVDDLQHLDLAGTEGTRRQSEISVAASVHSREDHDPESAVAVRPKEENQVPDTKEHNLETSQSGSDGNTTNASSPEDDKQITSLANQDTPSKARNLKPKSPTLQRAQSHPAGSLPVRKDFASGVPTTVAGLTGLNGVRSNATPNIDKSSIETSNAKSNTVQEPHEKKLSERLGLAALKNHRFTKGQSFIPRAVTNRKESRVSNLAKHFEQLSREFERERMREKRLRAARNKQSRVYPLAAPKPIVEVYNDVHEAVDEMTSSDDIMEHPEGQSNQRNDSHNSIPTAEGMLQTDPMQTEGEGFHVEETQADLTENDTEVQHSSHAPSEVDEQSDLEDSTEQIQLPDSPEDLLRLSQEDVDLKELPKHERTSLMKMLTNFWAERSSSGWSTLEYPFTASDHIFADCDIIVREDELSSIIAFAMDSSDYKSMLHGIQNHRSSSKIQSQVDVTAEAQADVMHSLLRKTGSHLKYQFQEGGARMLCKIFYAEQFDAMRRKCGVDERFVESLSRCMKFDSRGGKSKSLFLKTLDDRFVLKSLSAVETQSFLKFAPNYFQIMSEAFFHELPSVIAKMLGFYQIIIKNPITGIEHNWYLLVMENLFYDRVPTRIFDLKGSMRNRKINATGERNEVLLDENMVEFIYESPLFAREHSKKLLRSSVHNDTLFLARQNVMDYSLMIAIDEARKELVVGIIDCIRTYTWDKKLESWIKDRGFTGGGKNKPTVTSPKEYKRRFREAMSRYVLEAPNCWHQFRPIGALTAGEKAFKNSKNDADDGDKLERVIS